MIQVIGMVWYTEEDYPRILEIMVDAENLPRTYDRWRELAEKGERSTKSAGHTVIRAIIDPREFPAWCRARGLKIDAKARMQWGNEAAFRATKGSH